MPPIDPLKTLKDFQERAEFMLNADKHLAEVVGLLKETRDVLAKLNAVVDRVVGIVDDVENRVGSVASVLTRLDRLEDAALNIERATMKVEGAITALPRAVRQRITRSVGGGGDDAK